MLFYSMKPHGTYKIRYQRSEGVASPLAEEIPRAPRGMRAGASAVADDFLTRLARSERRAHRILDSLRSEILECGGKLRIRRIFETPREIYRVELALPDLGYLRTTLLDREGLEALLEKEDVREAVESGELG